MRQNTVPLTTARKMGSVRVETILRNYVCNDGSDRPAYCYSTQLPINTLCDWTTNESPYYVVFNRDPTLLFDLNLGMTSPQGLNNTHTTEDLATRCADTFQKAMENHKLEKPIKLRSAILRL